MTILKYLQLPYHFDVPRMQDDLRKLTSTDWQSHYQVKHYTGDWSAMALRSADGTTENVYVSPIKDVVYKDTDLLELAPYFREILDTFQCPLLAVRLLRLGAGSVIHEHRDADLSFEKGEVRIHIPVITHPDVEFYLQGERLSPREGECWYMNFNLPHALKNNSPVDRVHLVIDAKVNDWVRTIFNSDSVLHKKEIEEEGLSESTRRQMILHLREMNTEVSNKMADELESSLTHQPTS